MAHEYETDAVRIDIDPQGAVVGEPAHKSVLYALLEAACDTLEISRDDLGGTLMPSGRGEWSFILGTPKVSVGRFCSLRSCGEGVPVGVLSSLDERWMSRLAVGADRACPSG